jgi:hypothetical protein
LKDLKTCTKCWAKESKNWEIKLLENLEGNIKQHLLLLSDGSILPEVESNLIKLEFERNKHLKAQEDLWRLRSRAIWVQSGDQNTNFFHHFANHMRNSKHIWEIRDVNGTVHNGQEAIIAEVENYFKIFFKPLDNSPTAEQVGVAGLFTRLINEEEASELYKLVSLEELKLVVSLFKKEKVHGLMAGQWNFSFTSLI